jgi:hypothetical protein
MARALVLLVAAMTAVATDNGSVQRVAVAPGIGGLVLSPDGAPVTAGEAFLNTGTWRSATTIDRRGYYRLVPNVPGVHQLVIRVPGLAPYRVNVTVPDSRILRLPAITLSVGSLFRVRVVNAEGEPLPSVRLLRRWLDINGAALTAGEGPGPDAIESDGTITVGPLPRGIATLAIDHPQLAPLRLPDLVIRTDDAEFNGGTVVLDRGAVLRVDVTEENGAPLANYPVLLEDAVSFSPLGARRTQTDQHGRALFDRLAAGRFTVSTVMSGRCGNRTLSVARTITSPGRGTLTAQLIVGGRATIVARGPYGPAGGVEISAVPTSGSPQDPPWLRKGPAGAPPLSLPIGSAARGAPCLGVTDGEGRLTLPNFPLGTARVNVRLVNSTFSTSVAVRESRDDIVVSIPEGILPVRVVDASAGRPISRATITWTGRGTRVEAVATATGEALLEGIGPVSGLLRVSASAYHDLQTQAASPPADTQQVGLIPAGEPRVDARVTSTTGEPVAGAIVELSPAEPLQLGHIAATDTQGAVTFDAAPTGALRLQVTAEQFETAAVQVPADRRNPVIVRLQPRR